MARIKFSTDSAADIPAALREELSIQVLPFPIARGEKERNDGFDFTPQEFYEMLLSAPQVPTHAQLNPYVFTQCFEQAWKEGYTDLIHTSINSKGSATYGNALQAREEFYEDHPEARDTFHIYIIDSHNYTMSYGWPVLEGARMAAAGKEAEEIVSYIQDWVDHARVIFAALDLRFAKKSGRISPAAAFVGDAIGLKPLITFEDGEAKILSKARGEAKTYQTIVEHMRDSKDCTGAEVVLSHCENLTGALRLKELILTELPVKDVTILSCRGLTSFYAMENGLILGY